MKAIIIHDLVSGEKWTEIVAPEGHKWIDAARAGLDLAVLRRRLKHVLQTGVEVSVRTATQAEIASRMEELKLARALRFS